ncbi:MAG: vWA domain-containing protein [Candidatus Parabeggiatoa sp.]|nr:vWA domain-containing protein [Candidatus Parabeggiatoa sp.]
MLIHEAQIMANEYPAHTNTGRTKIAIPHDIQVDMSIVLDMTASMTQEMKGIITALKAIIAGIDLENAPLIALITFTDEVKINAFTPDISVLLEAIERLKVSGGGSCPEASAEALNIAIPHTKKGGDILFYTDASPYDDTDVENILEQMNKRRIRFHAMITGDCSQTESGNE